jgi:F1F0 ATPase subunit 2
MWFELATIFIAGIGFGLFYFGGLWLTVQRLEVTAHPGLLLVGSYIVRTLVVVWCFYLVMRGSWPRLLACLAGFWAVRLLLTARLAFMTTIASSSKDRMHAS